VQSRYLSLKAKKPGPAMPLCTGALCFAGQLRWPRRCIGKLIAVELDRLNPLHESRSVPDERLRPIQARSLDQQTKFARSGGNWDDAFYCDIPDRIGTSAIITRATEKKSM
jgi:hypothetical protein